MDIGKTLGCLAAAALVGGLAAGAVAQPPSGPIGEVLETDGPDGSVIVARGVAVYALSKGDALFEGDKIFTRSNATVRLKANGCERDVPKAASIQIGDDFCEAKLVTLDEEDVVGGVPVLANATPAPSAVGATPGVLALLASGGAAAAAAGSTGTVAID
jgi:hypothetical protein